MRTDSDQRKTSPASEDFPERCHTNCIHTQLPGKGALESVSPSTPVGPVFIATVVERLLSFKITLELGRGEIVIG